jgi:hypothetical protein
MDPVFGCDPMEKFMRNLRENSGPISRAGIAPLGPAVSQILQNLQTLCDNIMGFLSFDVGNKPYPTAIMLISGVIEALR